MTACAYVIPELEFLRSEFGRAIAEAIKAQYADYVESTAAAEPYEDLFTGEIVKPEARPFLDWLDGCVHTGGLPKLDKISNKKFVSPDDVKIIADMIQMSLMLRTFAANIVFGLLPDQLKTEEIAVEDIGSYRMRSDFLNSLMRDYLKPHRDALFPVEEIAASYDKSRIDYGKNVLGLEVVSPNDIADRFYAAPDKLIKAARESRQYIDENIEACEFFFSMGIKELSEYNAAEDKRQFKQTPEGRRAAFRVISNRSLDNAENHLDVLDDLDEPADSGMRG